MALREETIIDRIEILSDGQIQVRQSRRVYDDNDLLGERYHRYVLSPVDDASGIVDARLKAVAETVWTEPVRQSYRDKLARAKEEEASRERTEPER